MSRGFCYRIVLSVLLLALIAIAASCSLQDLLAGPQATATPTRTPRPPAAAASPVVAVAAKLALPTDAPTREAVPTAVPPSAQPALGTATEVAPTETAVPARATPVPATATRRPTALPPTTAPQAPVAPPATSRPAAPTNPPAPALDFVISELRVLGLGENNGGIEGPGSQHIIMITVVDAAGKPLDGAKIINTAPYPGTAVTGDYPAPGGKGPGKAEILMDKEEFRLKVESVNGGPVSSETSHNISLIAPVAQDIAGKLGDICRTLDNCPIPPYKHFSYVITFKRTH